MAFLNRDQIKEIVKSALEKVADFTGDIESYEFKHFQEYHKKVFITELKRLINAGPYYDRAGNIDYERYYDVSLSMEIINTWTILSDCINFISDNQTVRKRDPNRIQLS